MIIAKYVAVALIGYLLGAIPFGLIIGKRYARADIRQFGSGKTGTTNVLRVAGKKAAILVCLLDLAKGGLAVFLAGLVFGAEYLMIDDFSLWWPARSGQVVAALAAVAGHTWPVYIKFKGGRGVATYLGALLVLCPPAGLFGSEILIIGAGLTKYMSLGSIAGAVGSYAILVPLTIINGFPIEYLAFALLGAIFLIVMHRDNIGRLLHGRERKLGEKAQS
ncbi:MAG: glycerol-3-phosphate 1-O-acyltransferase PlsY [Dehalococcoidales bacterium]|nr:glycerol-3-phosphate 1-O-acyltransferase PlsY [Dehalococcoidales bacterium]